MNRSSVVKRYAHLVGTTTAIFAFTILATLNCKVNAWGPSDRPAYTMQSPSPAVTLNAIKDDSNWNDERNFSVVKDITDEMTKGTVNFGELAKSGGFKDTAELADGHYYMVKAIVHNSSAENLHLVAKNVRASINDSVFDQKTKSITLQTNIAADNCGASKKDKGKPCSIWDEVYLRNKAGDNKLYSMYYVPGAARYFNNKQGFATSGFNVSDDLSLKDKGAQLGYDEMNGNIPGCFQYAGYLTYIMRAYSNTPGLHLYKLARVNGSNDKYVDNRAIEAQPGDTIDYEVRLVGNDDKLALKGKLLMRDVMDNGLTYVPGSAKMYRSKADLDGNKPLQLSDNNAWIGNDVSKLKYLDFGSFSKYKNTETVFRYSAKVGKAENFKCGVNHLRNVMMALSSEGANEFGKLAMMTVNVRRNCADTTPKPAAICKYNRNLKADDKRCVKPGAPKAGLKLATATGAIVAVLVAGAVIVYAISRAKRKADK